MLPRELQPKIIPMQDLSAMHTRFNTQAGKIKDALQQTFRYIESKTHSEQIEQGGCAQALAKLKISYEEFLKLETKHQVMTTQIEKTWALFDRLSRTTDELNKAFDNKSDVSVMEPIALAMREANTPFIQEFETLQKLPIPLYENLLSTLSASSAGFLESHQAAEAAGESIKSLELLENAFDFLLKGVRLRIASKNVYERMIEHIQKDANINGKLYQLLIDRYDDLASKKQTKKEAEEKNAQGIRGMRDVIKRMPSPLPPKYEAKKQRILNAIDEYERTNSYSIFPTVIDPIFEELKNYLLSNCKPLPATAPNTPSSSPASSQNSSPSSSPNLSSVSISAKGGIGLFNGPLTPPKLELPATVPNTPSSSPASSQNSSPSSSPEKGLGQFNESPTPLKLEPAAQATPIQSAPVSQNNMLMFKQPKLESAATEATPLKGSPSSEKEDATSCVDKNCNIL